MSDDKAVIKELNEKVELDDNLDDDDYFEKLLSDNIEDENDDDDDSTKKSDNDDDDKTKESDLDRTTREELEAKIKTLEKEAKGRLTDTIKSRQEKRIMKEQLKELQGAVSSLLEKRKGEETETKDPLEDPKRKVEFGDDDKAFVDLSDVKAAIKEQESKTQSQLNEIKQAEKMRELRDQFTNTVNSVLDINREEYEPAYKVLQEAVKSLNNRVIEMQNRTNNLGDPKTGSLDVDVGIDLMENTPEEKAFLKDFPGLNVPQIARAFNSKRDLKIALNTVSKTLNNTTSAEDNKLLKEAGKKPGSLGGVENQSGINDTLIEKIGKLKSQDIMSITDAEEERILKLMREEEIRGE